MVQRPPQGYFPEPTKRILVVSPRNVPRMEAFFWGYGLQIVTGIQHLRGFVGMETVQARWMGEKFLGWQKLVATLAGMARRQPQTAYVGLQKCF